MGSRTWLTTIIAFSAAAAPLALGCGPAAEGADGHTRDLPYADVLGGGAVEPGSATEDKGAMPDPGFGPVVVPAQPIPDDADEAEATPADSGGDPEIAVAAQALSATPAATTSWQATGNHSGVSWVSADTNVAVGPTRVLVTTRAAISWYTKGGKQLRSPQAASSFFDLTGLGLPKGAGWYINDCRSLYDDFRARFFVLCLYHDNAATPKGQLLVAVSKANYPESGWFQYSFAASDTSAAGANADDDTDYVSIGVDRQAFYSSGGVALNGTFKYNMINIRSTEDMAAGLSASNLRRWVFSNWQKPDGNPAAGVIYPAVHHGATSTAFFVGRYSTDKVLIWGISNPFDSATRSVRRVTVTLQAFATPPSAMFQSPRGTTTLRLWTQALADWPLKAEWRANKLYFVNNDQINCGGTRKPGVRYVRLNTSNFASNTVAVERDRIFGCSSGSETDLFEYAWPSLAVNAAGDAGIVYNRSNTLSFAQLRMSAFMAADQDVSPSALMRAGDATYVEPGMPAGSTVGWADCSGAAVDPSDDTSIWLAGSYPTVPPSPQTVPNYGIWVSKLFGTLRADLVPISAASQLVPLRRGVSSPYTAVVGNYGDGTSAAASGKLYLSTNATISGSNVQLTAFTIPSLPRSATATYTFNLAVPPTVTPGTYYLGTCVDTASVVAEYSEINCMGGAGPVPAAVRVSVQ